MSKKKNGTGVRNLNNLKAPGGRKVTPLENCLISELHDCRYRGVKTLQDGHEYHVYKCDNCDTEDTERVTMTKEEWLAGDAPAGVDLPKASTNLTSKVA